MRSSGSGRFGTGVPRAHTWFWTFAIALGGDVHLLSRRCRLPNVMRAARAPLQGLVVVEVDPEILTEGLSPLDESQHIPSGADDARVPGGIVVAVPAHVHTTASSNGVIRR